MKTLYLTLAALVLTAAPCFAEPTPQSKTVETMTASETLELQAAERALEDAESDLRQVKHRVEMDHGATTVQQDEANPRQRVDVTIDIETGTVTVVHYEDQ